MDQITSIMALSHGCKGGLENCGQGAIRGIHPIVGTREGFPEVVSRAGTCQVDTQERNGVPSRESSCVTMDPGSHQTSHQWCLMAFGISRVPDIRRLGICWLGSSYISPKKDCEILNLLIHDIPSQTNKTPVKSFHTERLAKLTRKSCKRHICIHTHT